ASIVRPTAVQTSDAQESPAKVSFWALALGSVGVVFGDIGTSPLYAFRQALGQTFKTTADGTLIQGVQTGAVLGVVSLALWALILVVTVKYVLFVMRADNRGEGGVLSLMALAQAALGRRTVVVFTLGVIGAALFYGDSIITPAISVLSAIEGLKVVSPHLSNVVVPLSVGILAVLFALQRWGTQRVGSLFGPVMLLWFLAIGVAGL